ncbi:hypothetical protein [Streptomyces sp. NPDC092307]|uniref:SMODS domain-containing nucleotidyltransferase n=1 Tax=Streptomyces sp. NPDC092307 TaxID=3366013 RepID=UPI00380DC1C0
MATSTAAAFEEFDRIITPSSAMWQKVRERHLEVAAALARSFPVGSGVDYKSSRVFGSLARNTAIIPTSDIDVLAHFHVAPDLWGRHYRTDSSMFLQQIRSSLQADFTVRPPDTRKAIGLIYPDGLNVDVAAVVKFGTGYYRIPDGSGYWLNNRPDLVDSYLNYCHAASRGDLKKITRFAKQWNRTVNSPLSTYHLELIAAKTFVHLSNSASRALKLFFDRSCHRLSVRVPDWPAEDPASFLTWRESRAINSSLIMAREYANAACAAEDRGDHVEATTLWKMILGEGFPSCHG